MMKRISIILILIMVFGNPAFAARGYTDKDTQSLGNNDWRIDSTGNLLPDVTSTVDVGSATYTVDAVYTDELVLNGTSTTSIGQVAGAFTDNGTTIVATSDPSDWIYTIATNDLNVTGFTAGTGDIALENGQTIDGGTNNSVILGDNSDTLAIGFDGNDVNITAIDGSIELLPETSAADGTIDLMAGGDTDDYVEIIAATANKPAVNFNGCNGIITAASGTITFMDENITTTGTVSAGATTVTSMVIGDDVVDVVTDDELRFASNDEASTIEAYGYEAKDAILLLTADESDDNGDEWQLESDATTNALIVGNDTSGSMAAKLTVAASTGNVTLTGDVVNENADSIIMSVDDTFDFQSNDQDLTITATGYEAKDAIFVLNADQGDDAGDGFRLVSQASTNDLLIQNDVAGWGNVLTVSSTGDVAVLGTTPSVRVGDGGAEDSAVLFDGNAQDFHIGVDDTDDDLVIGLGNALGTTDYVSIDEAGGVTLSNDLTFSVNLTQAADASGPTTYLVIGIGSDQFVLTAKRK